jgi:hypothetical protein
MVQTYIGNVALLHEATLTDSLLDALDLMLVPLSVLHSTFLGLFERHLERLHSLHGRLQALLKLRQLAPQIRIVAHQLYFTIQYN